MNKDMEVNEQPATSTLSPLESVHSMYSNEVASIKGISNNVHNFSTSVNQVKSTSQPNTPNEIINAHVKIDKTSSVTSMLEPIKKSLHKPSPLNTPIGSSKFLNNLTAKPDLSSKNPIDNNCIKLSDIADIVSAIPKDILTSEDSSSNQGLKNSCLSRKEAKDNENEDKKKNDECQDDSAKKTSQILTGLSNTLLQSESFEQQHFATKTKETKRSDVIKTSMNTLQMIDITATPSVQPTAKIQNFPKCLLDKTSRKPLSDDDDDDDDVGTSGLTKARLDTLKLTDCSSSSTTKSIKILNTPQTGNSDLKNLNFDTSKMDNIPNTQFINPTKRELKNTITSKILNVPTSKTSNLSSISSTRPSNIQNKLTELPNTLPRTSTNVHNEPISIRENTKTIVIAPTNQNTQLLPKIPISKVCTLSSKNKRVPSVAFSQNNSDVEITYVSNPVKEIKNIRHSTAINNKTSSDPQIVSVWSTNTNHVKQVSSVSQLQPSFNLQTISKGNTTKPLLAQPMTKLLVPYSPSVPNLQSSLIQNAHKTKTFNTVPDEPYQQKPLTSSQITLVGKNKKESNKLLHDHQKPSLNPKTNVVSNSKPGTVSDIIRLAISQHKSSLNPQCDAANDIKSADISDATQSSTNQQKLSSIIDRDVLSDTTPDNISDVIKPRASQQKQSLHSQSVFVCNTKSAAISGASQLEANKQKVLSDLHSVFVNDTLPTTISDMSQLLTNQQKPSVTISNEKPSIISDVIKSTSSQQTPLLNSQYESSKTKQFVTLNEANYLLNLTPKPSLDPKNKLETSKIVSQSPTNIQKNSSFILPTFSAGNSNHFKLIEKVQPEANQQKPSTKPTLTISNDKKPVESVSKDQYGISQQGSQTVMNKNPINTSETVKYQDSLQKLPINAQSVFVKPIKSLAQIVQKPEPQIIYFGPDKTLQPTQLAASLKVPSISNQIISVNSVKTPGQPQPANHQKPKVIYISRTEANQPFGSAIVPNQQHTTSNSPKYKIDNLQVAANHQKVIYIGEHDSILTSAKIPSLPMQNQAPTINDETIKHNIAISPSQVVYNNKEKKDQPRLKVVQSAVRKQIETTGKANSEEKENPKITDPVPERRPNSFQNSLKFVSGHNTNTTKFNTPNRVPKTLRPIRDQGSARVNGLQPYRRADTYILSSSTSLISQNESSDDFPMIKEYKSLASTTAATAVNHGGSKNEITCSPFVPKISLPLNRPVSVNKFNPALNVPASNSMISVRISSGDSDTRKAMAIIAKRGVHVPDRSARVVVLPKQEEVKRETFIDLTENDTEDNLPSSNAPKIDLLSQTIEKVKQRTGTVTNPDKSSESHKMKMNDKKHEQINQPDVIDLDALETTPVMETVNSITRTLFALDRLSRQKSFLYSNLSQFEMCVEHLKALNTCLHSEREKQKEFMDKNMVKWKQPLTDKTIMGVENENEKPLTPSQKLIEKFSLKVRKPVSLKSPISTCKRFVLSSGIPKGSTPPVISKQTEQKPERRRTFRQVLNAYKQRKKQKKIPPPSHAKSLPQQSSSSTVLKLITPITNTNLTEPSRILSSQSLSVTVPSSSSSSSHAFVRPNEVKSEPNENNMLLKETTSKKKPPPLLYASSDDDVSVLPKKTSTRTRLAPRKLSNPKDPYYTSSDELALQKALALSIKTANEERRKQFVGVLPLKNTAEKNELMSPPNKKKKREVDHLVDTYWNESWLKDAVPGGSGRDTMSPQSFREERALHYAMARFAEMEQKSPSLVSPASSSSSSSSSNVKDLPKNDENSKQNQTNKRKSNETVQNEEDETRKKKRCSIKKGLPNESIKVKATSERRKKGMALLKKAKENVANKVKEKHLETRTASIVLDKIPLDKINFSAKDRRKREAEKPEKHQAPTPSTKQTEQATTPPFIDTVAVQKKEYLLVPKYKGFKDFTPIVVGGRTRRSATAEDRDKLKKHDFALMVVEKVGDQTKEIIVAEGEDKSQKLAEASTKMQEQYELLSKKKRYLSVSRHTGETVLHKAARLGYADIAEHGIKEGANVQAKDNAGWTALHEACAYGKKNVAEVLLRYGADPNCCSNSGIRPLHDAGEKGNIGVIRLLLAYGADPNIATYSGALPIDCTRNEQIKQFLKEHDIDHRFLKPNNTKETWEFSGSCDLLDTCDTYGIFLNIPPVPNQLNTVEFQMSARPLVNSIYLPSTNEHGSITGYKNYFFLSELLERLGCSRNAFYKHHKVEILIMKLSKLKSELAYNTSIGHLPDYLNLKPSSETPCSSKEPTDVDEEIELVTMGHYSLRKMMNFKMCRVDL